MRRPQHRAKGTLLFLLSGCAALLAPPTLGLANLPPVIADITLLPEASLTDVTFEVHCSATDPEGDTLSFEWEPQAGTLVGAEAHGPSVEWTLPSVAGQYMLTIRVNDGQGNVVTADRMVPLGPLRFYETLSTPTRVPTRVVAAPDGTLWMTDSSLGRVIHLNAGGVTLGAIDTAPRPLGIAVEDSGSILVGAIVGHHRDIGASHAEHHSSRSQHREYLCAGLGPVLR